ncbi:MAG: peptidylprolyl isomerase [bacterium]
MDSENKIIYHLVLGVIFVILIIFGAYFVKSDNKNELAEDEIDIQLDEKFTQNNQENMTNEINNKNENTEQSEQKEVQQVFAVMKTNLGDVAFELFFKDAPVTVQNFVKLSQEGFYDGVKFHRVIKDFMIQSGDPNSKDDDWSNDGQGGPGYAFKDEINQHKLIKGSLAMANSGPDTNGSQFFVVTADSTPWLDGKHTAFGQIVEGMETILAIENVETDKTQGDHPINDVVIESIQIVAQ